MVLPTQKTCSIAGPLCIHALPLTIYDSCPVYARFCGSSKAGLSTGAVGETG
jgi:hypothetical protein